MKTIDTLKERCSSLLTTETDTNKLTILKTISEVLTIPNAFKKLDAEIVLNMLKDLGYKANEVTEIYSKILKED